MAVTMIEQQPGCGPPAPVPVLQWEKEFSTLLALHDAIRPERILEIGTYHGGTLYHWLQHAWRSTTIVSLDSYAVGVDNRKDYDAWNTHGANLITLEGDSSMISTIRKVQRNAPFDLVVIDAGHYLAEVTRDWDNYRPMVRSGGLICLHDILTHPSWPSIEVGQLWEQIKKDYLTFEIVADRDAEWGGWGCAVMP